MKIGKNVNPANLSDEIRCQEQQGWRVNERTTACLGGQWLQVVIMTKGSSCENAERTALYVITAPFVFITSLVGCILCSTLSSCATSAANQDDETIRYGNLPRILTDKQIAESRKGVREDAEKTSNLAIASIELNYKWYNKIRPCGEELDTQTLIANPKAPYKVYGIGNSASVVQLPPERQPLIVNTV